MRAVIQRVLYAEVSINGKRHDYIDHGYLVYLGIKTTDNEKIAEQVARKIHSLRIFDDADGKMNLDLASVNGKILLISQFTLYGDTKGNNRPSFIQAQKPEIALSLYDLVITHLRQFHDVKTGIFGSHMVITSKNDGPVTIEIEID